jgi:hypothetical protein
VVRALSRLHPSVSGAFWRLGAAGRRALSGRAALGERGDGPCNPGSPRPERDRPYSGTGSTPGGAGESFQMPTHSPAKSLSKN